MQFSIFVRNWFEWSIIIEGCVLCNDYTDAFLAFCQKHVGSILLRLSKHCSCPAHTIVSDTQVIGLMCARYSIPWSSLHPLATSLDIPLICFASVWVMVGPVGFQFMMAAWNSRIHFQTITWPEFPHWSLDLPKIGAVFYISCWKDKFNMQWRLDTVVTS